MSKKTYLVSLGVEWAVEAETADEAVQRAMAGDGLRYDFEEPLSVWIEGESLGYEAPPAVRSINIADHPEF